MENLTDIGAVRRLLDKYDFRFSKALGQNFLINPSVCPRMAEASGVDRSSGVLEIGPGIGVLTRELGGPGGQGGGGGTGSTAAAGVGRDPPGYRTGSR